MTTAFSSADRTVPGREVTRIATEHRRSMRRKMLVLAGLAVALACAMVLDLSVGASNLPVLEVARTLLDPSGADPSARAIVWDIRMPYSLMAVLVGAALSLAGAEMQTILDNPLASPFTLGVSSAAAFGAALAIVLQLGLPGVPADWIVSANAFVFALLSVLLLQGLAGASGAGKETLVLVGIALVFVFNALVAVVQFMATAEALQQLVFWSMGSLTRATWGKLGILALLLAALIPFSMTGA